MSGRSKQDQIKSKRRAADMTLHPAAEPPWTRPPPEECESAPHYFFAPDGGDQTKNRIIVRLDSHRDTHLLVEFAIVQQTFFRGHWQDVVEVDTCHDVDVHLHQYARSTGERIGDPEVLMPVTSAADIQAGYDAAYDRVVVQWEQNRRRWHDG